MSTIKTTRALRAAKIGSCHGSAAAMLDAIPKNVIDALPSRLVGELVDANWRLCQQTKALHERDICAEGAIWDARHQTHRELN